MDPKAMNAKRGEGFGSRFAVSTDDLPDGWRFEKRSEKFCVWFDDQGRRYKSSKEVQVALRERRLLETDEGGSATDTDASEYAPSPVKRPKRTVVCKEPIPLPNCLFVGQLIQVEKLLKAINHTRHCCTPNCRGELVPVNYTVTGLGGAALVKIACSGCGIELDYASSAVCQDLKRHTVVSLSLRVAAFVSGIGFAGYDKLFKRHLGMHTVTDKQFYATIEMCYPHVKDMLDEICEVGKDEMKALPDTDLGSWKRAVTTSDGAWHIRGFFSQNSTFVIRNFLTGALLWYGHASMRGSDSLIEDDLYEGTAKSAEGFLAAVLFKKANDEGCSIEINWQDQDSSSEKSFRSVFGSETSARVMKCGGHVGRAHGKALKSYKAKKEFTEDYMARHENDFPSVRSVTCKCKGKRHSKGCGCITDAFIESAKRNLFCAITQCGNDSDQYARRMRELGGYHAKGIHQWDTGQCDFHPMLVCSCGKCENDELKCEGKAYESKNVLTCDLHALAYEIECNHRAAQAAEVIDPELGRGHSNLCEATFSVLPKFRPKDTGLHRLHYQTSTNLGLIQSSMTYLYAKRGSNYHWVLELFRRMGLPELDDMREFCQRYNVRRMEKLRKRKEEETVRARVQHKKDRRAEIEKRKAWVKRQTIVHFYGDEDDEDDTISAEQLREHVQEELSNRKGCNRCGSLTHKRSTHKECPFNKANLPTTLPDLSEDVEVTVGGKGCNRCGSLTHKRSTHKDCPFNKRYGDS